MTIKLGVVMDPITHITITKDSTFAMLLAAQAAQWELYYMEAHDLFVRDGVAYANVKRIQVQDQSSHWFTLDTSQPIALGEMDVILMRKDPPFTIDYIYLTYILELAENKGTFIINKPASLRDANEKMAINWFPHCIAPTLVSCDISQLRAFLEEQQDIVVKPLDNMGGRTVFRLTSSDPNISVILETMTLSGKQFIMAQRFLPEIQQGDKRIILINGEPIAYALARVPAPGELRGNLAAGGTGHCVPLSERDYWLCQQIAPTLRSKGLFLVGLDVIGDYITEINVTSPTCMREITRETGIDIAKQVIDTISEMMT